MKVKDAFKVIMADEELRGKFKKNPVGALKDQGVDTDNLPPEVLDKIAGAGGTTEGVTTGTTSAVSVSSI